jgi:hypothetical protein
MFSIRDNECFVSLMSRAINNLNPHCGIHSQDTCSLKNLGTFSYHALLNDTRTSIPVMSLCTTM